MLRPSLLGFGVAHRFSAHSRGVVLVAVLAMWVACEQAKSRNETESSSTSGPTGQHATIPTHSSPIGDRILGELRALKPNLKFSSVRCTGDVTPVAKKKLACVVQHSDGTTDRHIEVAFTDARGGYVWGRKHLGTSFDKRLLGVLRKSWPVPLVSAKCPVGVVSYAKAEDECEVRLVGGQVEHVLVTWRNSLGKFNVRRLADMAALQNKIKQTLEARGDRVRSVSCPRRIFMTKTRFVCAVQLDDGISIQIKVIAESGKAKIQLPKKEVK